MFFYFMKPYKLYQFFHMEQIYILNKIGKNEQQKLFK